MWLPESLKGSIKNIRAHKLRSFLTMLGMIIGIAAVIIVISVGAGAQSLIVNQIQGAGSNLVTVLPGAADDEGPPASVLGITVTTLTYEDALALTTTHKVPHLTQVASYVQGSGTLRYQDKDLTATFVGTTASYTDVEDVSLTSGRFFDEDEERGLSRVAVLGSSVAQDLFGANDPIGKNIKIKKETFKVIGVVEERGVVFFVNEDNKVFVPLKTAQTLLLGINHVSSIRGKVDNDENLDQVIADTRLVLRELHGFDTKEEDDFTVRTPQVAADVFTSVTDGLKFFLAAIASIALVVGGIGIMNIMLVAVNERIREVGLRKAVGAKKADILIQFLIETAMISLVGGLIGVLIGVVFSGIVALVANFLGYEWSFIITFSSIFLAAGFSIVIGLIFGLYPAWKAAKLDPLTALRYE